MNRSHMNPYANVPDHCPSVAGSAFSVCLSLVIAIVSLVAVMTYLGVLGP